MPTPAPTNQPDTGALPDTGVLPDTTSATATIVSAYQFTFTERRIGTQWKPNP